MDDLIRTTIQKIGSVALAGIFVAAVMGFLMAGGLLNPIHRLTQASKALVRGKVEQRVLVTSQDEFGLLTTTINQISADLAQADQQRKRITADITHDQSTSLLFLKYLMENALRYTPEGGRISLNLKSGQQILIQVIDNSLGIEADDLPYVFDRFYRADKARGANSGKLGLGLAICKALVIAQGGAISATSAGKGQGTTMTISFDPAPSQQIQDK
jgi:signal transduction histidine kinase